MNTQLRTGSCSLHSGAAGGSRGRSFHMLAGRDLLLNTEYRGIYHHFSEIIFTGGRGTFKAFLSPASPNNANMSDQ